MTAKRETALQSAILDTLRKRFHGRILIERINAGTVMVGKGSSRRPFSAAPAGWSDLIGVFSVISGVRPINRSGCDL